MVLVASQQSTVDSILSQIQDAGHVSAKKMFGEYGIFVDGKMAAIVGDDQLFVKITAGGAALVGECDEVPPYPGAKPCFLVPQSRWQDSEWMTQLFRVTAEELPEPKKKK